MTFFFFSSRRRHTRLQGDWSSDVCSSDLDLSTVRGRRLGGRDYRSDEWPPARSLDTGEVVRGERVELQRDRKSTRLNSSHLVISYAVFCLKKKKTNVRLRRLRTQVRRSLI